MHLQEGGAARVRRAHGLPVEGAGRLDVRALVERFDIEPYSDFSSK